MWSYSRSIVNQTHHSSVIIIITITAYHCSLFNVYQTVTACYCAKAAGGSHCRWEFSCSPIKYAIPIPIKTIPIPIPIPIPISSQYYSNSHGNPMGVWIPIPMHTSMYDILPVWCIHLYEVLPGGAAGSQQCRWWCWRYSCFPLVSASSSENLLLNKREWASTPHSQNVCLRRKSSNAVTYWQVRFPFCSSLYTCNVLYVVSCFRSLASTFYWTIMQLLIGLWPWKPFSAINQLPN